MRSEFHDRRDVEAIASRVVALGNQHDVYFGVLPRFKRSSGGLDALRHGHVLFADVDTPEAVGAVAGFDPWPSVTVRTSDAGLHCYPTAGLAAWLDRQASAPVDDLIRRRAA